MKPLGRANIPVEKRIILDLCGGTGAWSAPYREAGYDVLNITLPDYDVRTYVPPKNVYGILAAPPCTMFSLARTRAKTPRDFRQGMEVVFACLKIVWECRYASPLKFWALENPTGFLRQFLGKPAFSFKSCEFGDASNKRTDLWGYFKPPKRIKHIVRAATGKHGESVWYKECGTNSALRAITPPGFARAFFKANQ